MRGVDGGPLGNARFVEAWTALLIGLNVRYKVPEGMGFRLTHLPE
jgi:predicted dinucleotide-binding enzyme